MGVPSRKKAAKTINSGNKNATERKHSICTQARILRVLKVLVKFYSCFFCDFKA